MKNSTFIFMSIRFLLRGAALAVFFQFVAVQAFGQVIKQPPPAPVPTYLQIVAHQDDDFLFMNPEVSNQIFTNVNNFPFALNVNTVTVYVTAGQACGATVVGSDSDNPCILAAPVLTRQEFAAARQNGIRAAYAQMANVPDVWTRTLVQPDAIHTVEIYTLNAAPRVKLIFMNLPDGGDVIPPYSNAINTMFDDPSFQTSTIDPVCDATVLNAIPSCDEQTNEPPFPLQTYVRADIVAVLSALVQKYQPTEVRTLDPQPFEIVAPDGMSFIVSFDNTDHTAVARYVDEVLATYHGPSGTGRYTVDYYKGYSSPDYPANLGQQDFDNKLATANTYIPYDPNFALNQDGYIPYYSRAGERYPASTTWLQRSSDGRLVAMSVEDRHVKYWYETTPGGPWTGPLPTATLNSSPVSPHLTLVTRADGLLQIFALRLPLAQEDWAIAPGAPPQDVITAVQVLEKNGAIHFGQWQSVGSPDTGQFVGVQTAAVDGSGRTFVFAKNSQGLVSYTYSVGKGWAAWDSTSFFSQFQSYFGTAAQDILDGIAAVTRTDGVIEVFATLRVGPDGQPGAIWHFVQNPGSTTFALDPTFTADPAFNSERAASSPTVALNQNGQVEIFYREEADAVTGNPGGRVLTVFESNGIIFGPTVLYGDAGAGPVAAIQRGTTGEIMLFERSEWSGISETQQMGANQSFYLQWQDLSGEIMTANEYPAAATDNLGRVVAVEKGIDGRLYMAREVSATSVGLFGPWTQIGK